MSAVLLLGLGCGVAAPEPEPDAPLEVGSELSEAVFLSDWVVQDLPDRLLVSEFGYPDRAGTFCQRRVPPPTPVGAHGNRLTMEWLHFSPADPSPLGVERLIEADLFTQLGPTPSGPFTVLGTVQAFNAGGFAGPAYSRACWGSEPRSGSRRGCDLDDAYGIIPMNAGMNYQRATRAAYNTHQWGFVNGLPHRPDSTRRWPLPAPLAAFPAGAELFNELGFAHAPWRLVTERKRQPAADACLWRDEVEAVSLARHRYALVKAAPFGTHYADLLAARGGGDSALQGAVDVLVHLAEYQTFACRGLASSEACQAVPVCAWAQGRCATSNARAAAFERALNQATEDKLGASYRLGSAQSLHGQHLEMNAWVRGWGRVAQAWGTDPDCDLRGCVAAEGETRYACYARCNGTFGFHLSGEACDGRDNDGDQEVDEGCRDLTGYHVPPEYTGGAQPFQTPFASSLGVNLRRTGYDPLRWRVGAGYSIRAIAREARGICAGRPANCDPGAYECRARERPAQARWCPF